MPIITDAVQAINKIGAITKGTVETINFLYVWLLFTPNIGGCKPNGFLINYSQLEYLALKEHVCIK